MPSAERKQQLSALTLRILADRGLAGLTAKNLGIAAGISDAAVFKHYSTMESVVAAAIDRFEELLALPGEPESTSPLERLRWFFITRLDQVTANPELLDLAFSNSLEAAAGSTGAVRVRRIMGASISYIQRAIREGARCGEIRSDVSGALLTWMIHGALQAAARRRLGRLTTTQIWDQVSATISAEQNTTR